MVGTTALSCERLILPGRNTRGPSADTSVGALVNALVYDFHPVIADASVTYTLDEFWHYNAPFPIKLGGDFVSNPNAGPDNQGWSAGVLFEYPDETKATANPVDRNLIGGRVSGGIQLEKDALLVRAELSELFAPAPVYTRLDSVFDIPVGGPMAVNAGIGLFARHIGFTSDSGGKMRIGGLGMDVGVGVSYLAF